VADSFKIEGLADVERRLKTLAPKLAKKGLRAAARKSMNIVRDAARAGARAKWDDPATKDSIPKNIVTSESGKQGRRIGGIVMRVGVRGGAQPRPGNVGYWRFLELGTSEIAPRPVLRPALESNVGSVVDKLVKEINL
jgi:HK97 gp10 family phage protein